MRLIVFKNKILIIFSTLLISGLALAQDKTNISSSTIVEIKKKELKQNSIPLKGRFLDYIFMIRPDHKKKNYSIDTTQLADGYAFGSGPYDGWLVEFFLFRGRNKDIVFEQISGYEVDEKDKIYGLKITPYIFEGMNKSKAKIGNILPLKLIEKLFSDQIKILKTDVRFGNRWKYYKHIKFPMRGTNVELKICNIDENSTIAPETECVLVGVLKWNKSKFNLFPVKNFSLSS